MHKLLSSFSPVLLARARTAAERTEASTAYRALARFKAKRGTRLAAAMTYSAFLSLFPLLAVATAIAAAALGPSAVRRVDDHFRNAFPELADKISLTSLSHNVATVGLISGAVLLWSGLSWVNAARGSMRAIWSVDDMPGSFLERKAADLVALAGFGVTLVLVGLASALTSGLAANLLGWVGLRNTDAARALLWILGTLIGLAAGTVMFAYMLSGIPRLSMPHRVLFGTSLVAAILFQVTRSLVAAYLSDVAGKSIYGVFGAPVAVLVWFNLTFMTVLALSAWTAARTEDAMLVKSREAEEADRP